MADDNGNGRVTQAIIGAKLDTVISKLDAACEKQDQAWDRITVLEQRLASEVLRAQTEHGVFRRDIEVLDKKLDHVDSRDKWTAFAAGLAAIMAGGLGWLKP